MQPLLTLIRRELGSYFVSLAGYVIIAVVQLLVGQGFLLLLESLNGKPFDVPVTEAFFNNGLFWLILLIAGPVITMRTFASEKFSGTYETLMTTPVSDAQVVLAKFIGALLFFLFTWLPVTAYPYLLRHFSVDLPVMDNGMLASTLFGFFLFGSLYVSLGCFASSLTRSQIIAAMNAFAMGLGLFLLSFLSLILPVQSGWLTKLLAHISMIEHMRDFSRGVVDTGHVVYYASFTIFFLYLTFKVVESRRWK
jgi:ABC-2 type transport system permease protein